MSLAEPVFAKAGEGAWLVDAEGNRLLDFANGGSLPLGYTLGAKTGDSPPEGTGPRSGVENTPRVCPQRAARGTVPVFASYSAPGADGVLWPSEVTLMHKLAELVPGGMNRRVLVCESGREALARAIELARNETGRQGVVYLSEIADELGTRSDSSAESVMSRAAAVVAHPLDGRIKQVRQACDAAGALLIDDETGIGPGATGRMFAIELLDVRPDIYVLGRGWAAGLPFGACVTGRASLRWARATVGNPAGSTAALETIRLLEAGLLQRVKQLSTYLEKRFGALSCARLEPELWGVGLVRTIAFRTGKNVAEGFVQRCRELGLLLTALGTRSVSSENGDSPSERADARYSPRFPVMSRAIAVRPPLVAKEKDVDFAAEVLGKVLAGFEKKA